MCLSSLNPLIKGMVMQSVIIDHVVEVEYLIKNGVLNEGMRYHFDKQAEKFLSLYNRIEDRLLCAEISYDCRRQEKAFFLCIIEQVAQGEAEVVSTYEHADVAHLVKTAKGFLCIYSNGGRKMRKATPNISFTIRTDAELRKSFYEAAEAYGECPTVVLRQLMRYFVGRGPDPRMSLSFPLARNYQYHERHDNFCHNR
jgi:hypothetical protein